MNQQMRLKKFGYASINHFSVFCILYMASFLCEMAETWRDVGFTWFFLILICSIVFTKVNRFTFLSFLLLSTAYKLIFHFPEVANHVNFIILANLTLIIGIIYSYFRRDMSDEDYYRMMMPYMRLALILVYFIAGFHKFNQDFFHPNVSCINRFLSDYILLLTNSKVFFIPSALLLITSLGILSSRLLGHHFRHISSAIKFSLLAFLVLAIVVFVGLLTMIQGALPMEVKSIITLSIAGVIVAWELIGGPLLLVPKFQGPVLAFSIVMHASFALIGFVDFSSFAFAAMFTFIPPAYLGILDNKSHIRLFNLQVHRVYIYFLILLLGSFLTGIHYRISPVFGDMNFFHGMILMFAFVVFCWPILSTLLSQQHLSWEGVSILEPKTSLISLIGFALVIILFGMTSYLGLRTAGNFSMFSNLRTEGEVSNHFLLRTNSLKIWGYQEDIVKVLEIDDDAAKLGHKYRPLKGNELPVVEFRKLVYKWDEANYVVPIRFVHNGVEYSSDDIVNDPTWRTPTRDWEMYLMDFRVIQPEGPNQCRW